MSVATCPVPPRPLIPKSLLEEVTGCKVLTYYVEDGSKPGDNFMSVLYTVTAQVVPPEETQGSGPQTRYYLFKCTPRHPSRQTYLNKTNMIYNELAFYSIWAKELVNFQLEIVGLPKENLAMPAFPQYVGGKAIDFSKPENFREIDKVRDIFENFIVLTDLRRTWGYQMVDRKAGLEYEHVKMTVLELAKIHALSWAYQQKVEPNITKKFPFLKPQFDEIQKSLWGNITYENCKIAMNNVLDEVLGPGNELSKSLFNSMRKIGKFVDLLLDQSVEDEKSGWDLHRQPPNDMVKASEAEEPWRVMLHGDAWCNNLMFKNDASGHPESVMLIDFQLSRPGCPSVDLAHLLYTSTSTQFRENHTSELLKVYFNQFTELCKVLKLNELPGFSIESLTRKFHRSKILGFFLAIVCYPMMYREDGGDDLEQVKEDVSVDDMFLDTFSGGTDGSVYKTKILELCQELYNDGVL